MDIDMTQPWGIAVDYAGRATLTEAGHTVHIRIHDSSLSTVIEPDPLTGTYPPVNVTAHFSETGDSCASLRGYGQVSVSPAGTDPVVPDQSAVSSAVAAAISDFESRKAAYVALCAAWTTGQETGTTA